MFDLIPFNEKDRKKMPMFSFIDRIPFNEKDRKKMSIFSFIDTFITKTCRSIHLL